MGSQRTGFSSGSRYGNSNFSRNSAGVLKERANMSFMLVVMFFAVFGLIVLTEIFLIDERRDGVGGTGAFGGHRSGHRLLPPQDRPDYEEVVADDYINVKGGFDAQISLLLMSSNNNNNSTAKGVDISANSKSLSSLSSPNTLPTLENTLHTTYAEWLPVTKTKFKFFVYSAYFDDRVIRSSGAAKNNNNSKESGLIRIIGATKTKSPERVWCRLWYRHGKNGENSTLSVTVSAKVRAIRENWNLKYSACFIFCSLPKDSPIVSATSVPEAVSVVGKIRATPTNRLYIHNRPGNRPTKRDDLAICVKPMHNDYNKVLRLVEFIELQRILGANHIILYNDTVGSEAARALKYYENRGLVTILPWHHLDMISQREIRTEGIFAALNDCVYRSMYKYEYVALLDLDEFIIPRHNDTIIEFIRWLSSRINTKTSSAFSFQNAFFYLQWPDDALISKSKVPLEVDFITLRKTRRKSKLHPHKQRSKYICKPRDVIEAGNHFVWELVAGQSTLNVPSDAAILHHYRLCEFGGNDCIKTPFTIDQTAHKYRDKLRENVSKILSELGENVSSTRT